MSLSSKALKQLIQKEVKFQLQEILKEDSWKHQAVNPKQSPEHIRKMVDGTYSQLSYKLPTEVRGALYKLYKQGDKEGLYQARRDAEKGGGPSPEHGPRTVHVATALLQVMDFVDKDPERAYEGWQFNMKKRVA